MSQDKLVLVSLKKLVFGFCLEWLFLEARSVLDEGLAGQSSGKTLFRTACALNACGLLQELYQGHQALSQTLHGLVRGRLWRGQDSGMGRRRLLGAGGMGAWIRLTADRQQPVGKS